MNSEAIKAGIIHAVKVLAWIAGSAIVAYLTSHGVDALVPGFSTNWPLLVLIINPVLAGIKRWLDERPQV